MTDLTTDQLNAAAILKMRRPPVLPGTNAIVDQSQAHRWYREVTAEMDRLGVNTPVQVRQFCDIAGVPD